MPTNRKFLITTPAEKPLLVIGSQETYAAELLVRQADVQVLQVYKKGEEVKAYGDKAKGGVVIASVKGNPPLYRLSGILDHFQVPASQRGLQVLVNHKPVNADFLLADLGYIQKVEVTRQDPTAFLRASLNPEEEFLNIVTEK